MTMQATIDVINETIRYTNWTVYRRMGRTFGNSVESEVADWVESCRLRGIEVRGIYDLRAFRGDADIMVWTHAPSAADIQHALRMFERTTFGRAFTPQWSGMGMHRPAEFNRSHVPGFMLGAEPREWLCMYPFVRSYDWYLLPQDDRSRMLVEHGAAGHKYAGIVSSTVAAFALGDYEWLLALESSELHEIVDMMRELRYTEARRHVREEVPFFTGRRINLETMGELFA
ncbi:chlorite dismutase [Microbacteriaceae bacterium MWH-Ta3]|nr:chlorite dismutase [Microbacteriaceae bacterium MWH-Ta3]